MVAAVASGSAAADGGFAPEPPVSGRGAVAGSPAGDPATAPRPETGGSGAKPPSAAAEPLATAATTPHDYKRVRTAEDLAALAAELAAAPEFAFDTETDGLDPRHARCVGLSFSTAPGTGWYVPLAHEVRDGDTHGAAASPEPDLFSFFEENTGNTGNIGNTGKPAPVQLDLFGDLGAAEPAAPVPMAEPTALSPSAMMAPALTRSSSFRP